MGDPPKASRMSSGDPTPLDHLVDEHLPEAMRFAIRLTGDPAAAEDLLQDAFLRAARSWHNFKGQSRFRTWLFRIIINVFRDRTPHRPAASSIQSDLVDPRAGDPAAEILHVELSQFVAARVSALPARQREVLVLITYEG